MTTALTTTQVHEEHTNHHHPEAASRLVAVQRALARSGLLDDLLLLEPAPASEAQLAAVHRQRLIDVVRLASARGGVQLTADTYTTAGSWDAARLAAGAAVRAVEAVVTGEANNACVLVRPPGHHATPDEAMGFCLFNNIAVAARHACAALGISRVAIVDYDVHHGNGTQDIFYDDAQVLFVSSHAYGQMFFPGSGAWQEMGHEDGYGTTLNVPLPFDSGDANLRRAYETLCLPAVRAFAPQLILVSAGFDAHWADPLGTMNASVAGYTWLNQQLLALADEQCGGRIVFVLEGGYNHDVLAACVLATLRQLLGRDPGPDPFGPAAQQHEPEIAALLERIKRVHPALQ